MGARRRESRRESSRDTMGSPVHPDCQAQEDANNHVLVEALTSWKNMIPDTGAFVSVESSAADRQDDEYVCDIVAQFEERKVDCQVYFDMETGEPTAISFAPRYTTGERLERAGLNTLIGMGTVFCVLIFISLIMQPDQTLIDGYQRTRILAWLNPAQYANDAYQQQNSIMAIGSGQLVGKGLNNNLVSSVKNGSFIAEPQTDFIFAVAGEELGFIGCATIILLLALIVLECIQIGRRSREFSGTLICCGVAGYIGFQSFVNICVATGLMPNTGIPLPFVSYGLTSLVTLYMSIGFVLNVGLQPKKY